MNNVVVETPKYTTLVVHGDAAKPLASRATGATITQSVHYAIASGAQGPMGPQGATGPQGPSGGSVDSRVAGEALDALTAVWEDTDGKIYALDQGDTSHIDLLTGVTITAASVNDVVGVRAGGSIALSGGLLVAGSVWLGANGALTQIAPTTGHLIHIGTVTGGYLYVNIGNSINLGV